MSFFCYSFIEDSIESTDRSDTYSRRFRLRDPDFHRHRFARERYRSPDRGDRYGARGTSLGRSENSRDGGPRKRRCRNFEEHGVCAAGSRCPFDHGPYALVLPSPKTINTTAAVSATVSASLSSNSHDNSTKNTTPSDQRVNLSSSLKSTESHVVPTTTLSIPILQSAGEPLLGTPDGNTMTQTLSTASMLPVYRPTPSKCLPCAEKVVSSFLRFVI